MRKPDSCLGCPIYDDGLGFSEIDGKGSYGVAIVGEALNAEERIEGKAFKQTTSGGSVLEIAFRYAGLDRQGFSIGTMVSCQPPSKLTGKPYEHIAIERCRPNLERVYSNLNPLKQRVTLAASELVLKHLVGMQGKNTSTKYLRGYVLSSQFGWVVPMFSPAFLRQDNMNLLPLMKTDMQLAIDVANGSYTKFHGHDDYVEPSYNIAPSLDDVIAYYHKLHSNQRLPISCDIETDNTVNLEETDYEQLANEDIKLVQFSSAIGTGMAVPFREPYIKWIFDILALANAKVGFNWWSFDEPRLRSLGAQINGNVHDIMWMFKHLQPELPRGLQSVASYGRFPFPWKHMFDKNLEWYGCADVDAPLHILSWLMPALRAQGKSVSGNSVTLWDGYYSHVYELRAALYKAERRGIPVNEEKRQQLERDLIAERSVINAETDKHIPEDIKAIKPKRKLKPDQPGYPGFSYGYKREPKLIKEAKLTYNAEQDKRESLGLPRESFRRYVKRKHELYYREFIEDGQIVKRWCKIDSFKGSSKQVIEYIKWKREKLAKLANEIAGVPLLTVSTPVDSVDTLEV